MYDWDEDVDARRLATVAFCRYLDDPAHAGERDACKNNSDIAKKLFAKLGSFYVEGDPVQPGDEGKAPIPKKTAFYVLEDDERLPRDSMVTLVLPSRQTPLDPNLTAESVYRCTWNPWTS